MPTLPNMGLITPTLGGDSGTWDDKLNAIFALVDAHDHTSGKGVLVPVAGLNINADLPMNDKSFTGLHALFFNAIAALAAGSKALFVNTADNELYWRSNAGVNVKLTAGASINTALVGGIVGDYSSVGAALAYDDANKRYTLKTQTATWARLATGPVRIFEFNTSESVYVEHAVDAALAASYTVTWPAALPLVQTAVQITAAGVVVFSNTFPTTIVAPDYKLSATRQRNIPASAYCVASASSTCSFAAGPNERWVLGNQNTETLKVPLVFDVSDRIVNFTLYLNKASDATNTITVEIVKYNNSTGARTSLASKTNNGAAPGAISMSLAAAVNETIGTGFSYQLEITQSDATPSGSDVIFNTVVDYDRP